jgi:hypothetical protein
MKQNTCENLTKIIRDLANMKPGFDKALEQLNLPETLRIRLGADDRLEAFRKIIPALNAKRFGLDEDLYLSLLEKVGSVEELKKRFVTVEIGGKSGEQILNELKQNNIILHDPYVAVPTKLFLESEDFISRSRKKQKVETVRLSLGELGFEMILYGQLLKRIEELGLSLCPAEVAFPLRIYDKGQPNRTHYNVISKLIEIEAGTYPYQNDNVSSYLYQLAAENGRSYLNLRSYQEEYLCLPENEFVFQINRDKQNRKNK